MADTFTLADLMREREQGASAQQGTLGMLQLASNRRRFPWDREGGFVPGQYEPIVGPEAFEDHALYEGYTQTRGPNDPVYDLGGLGRQHPNVQYQLLPIARALERSRHARYMNQMEREGRTRDIPVFPDFEPEPYRPWRENERMRPWDEKI